MKKIGERVQEFYNKTPFPDYELDRFNDRENLKVAANEFAKILDRSIPPNASIIDVGTGTGQLAAYLSLRRKCVWGIDFSRNSLKKARVLKQKLGLNSLHLAEVDILDNRQIEALGQKFDYVLCLGVLHHLENPYQGFKNTLNLLQPGGYLSIGLYHWLGRLPLKIRRLLVKTLFKNNPKIKEQFIKMQIGEISDPDKIRGWWQDQYEHPYEKSHTVGEVLNWFQENRIEFWQTLPPLAPFDEGDLRITGVWNKDQLYPFLPIRLYQQLTWAWKTQSEGGYWLTFGKKLL